MLLNFKEFFLSTSQKTLDLLTPALFFELFMFHMYNTLKELGKTQFVSEWTILLNF